jgi:tetratricopeptide (TPR) repeat protein
LIAAFAALLAGCTSLEDMGDEAAARGDWDTAVKHYHAAMAEEATPELTGKLKNATETATKLHIQAGRQALSAGQPSEAVKEFEVAKALSPQWPGLEPLLAQAREAVRRAAYKKHLGDARAYRNDHQLTAATRSYQSAIQAYEKHPEAKAELQSLAPLTAQGTALSARGHQALERRAWKEALGYFDQALAFWSDHHPSIEGRASAKNWINYEEQMARARSLRSQGDLRGAFEAYDQATQHQVTKELESEMAEVGATVYPVALADAASERTRAEALRSGSLDQTDAYFEAYGLFSSAARYKRTGETERARSELLDRLQRDLVARGERSVAYLDTASAIETLERAAGVRANVTAPIKEARYLDGIWKGLEAEAAGREGEAEDGYRKAWFQRENVATEIAEARIAGDRRAPSARAYATASSGGSRREELETDLTQRSIASYLRTIPGVPDTELRPGDLPPVQLGQGVDLIEGEVRRPAVRGRAARRQEASARTSIQLVSAFEPAGEPASLVPGLLSRAAGADAPLPVVGASGAGFALRVRVRHRSIGWVETLADPKPDLERRDAAEWQATFGTHWIAALGFGAEDELVLFKACSSEEEYRRLADRVRSIAGDHAGEARSQLDGLERIIVEEELLAEGVHNRDAAVTAQDFRVFRKQMRASDARVRRGQEKGLVRVWARSFGGSLPLPLEEPSRLDRSIRRRLATHYAKVLLPVTERAALEAIELEKLRKFDEAQAQLAFAVLVDLEVLLPVDLRGSRFPSSFTVNAVAVEAAGPVEALLVKARDVAPIPAQGLSDPELARLRGLSLLRFDGRVDPSPKSMNVRLQRGEYRWLIVNHGPAPLQVRGGAGVQRPRLR